MNVVKYLSIFALILSTSCSSVPFSANVIMFDKEVYAPTNPNNLEIYETRLAIPHKYFDIGTIKYEGSPNITRIKELGAQKGADALLKDGKNFILIIYQTREEEKSNEKKST